MQETVIVVAIVLFVLVLIFRAITVVRHNQALVIERFGQFRKIAGAGLTVRVPMIDRVRARVDLREQVLAYPSAGLPTADGRTVTATMKVFFKVADAQAAIYGNPGWLAALEQAGKTKLADEISHLDQADAVRSGRVIAGMLRASLHAEVGRWGIAVNSLELTVEPGH